MLQSLLHLIKAHVFHTWGTAPRHRGYKYNLGVARVPATWQLGRRWDGRILVLGRTSSLRLDGEPARDPLLSTTLSSTLPVLDHHRLQCRVLEGRAHHQWDGVKLRCCGRSPATRTRRCAEGSCEYGGEHVRAQGPPAK